jgi:hypothetical protein
VSTNKGFGVLRITLGMARMGDKGSLEEVCTIIKRWSCFLQPGSPGVRVAEITYLTSR